MPMNNKAAGPIPGISDIIAASTRIESLIRTTPVLSDPRFNDLLGCELWLKCENLQRTGAFKFRGACNAIARLDETGRKGAVATHSSGNHGAALALAAALNGRESWVVMPENSVKTKIEAVRANGGRVVFCAPNQQAREQGLAELIAKGCIAVPPYDDFDIICGQGTAMIEIAQQCPGTDIVITPVGGGGLISGTAIAASALVPNIAIFGAEPAGAADTALSLEQGKRVDQFPVDTIADGLRAIVGDLNFRIIRDRVDRIITISDQQIIEAMALVWRHFRLLIETSSATVVAAILASPDTFSGKRVAAVVSGGNVDLDTLPF